MSKRQNKINRQSVSIQTKLKPVSPEDRVFLEREISHKAYGSVKVVVDGNIGQRVQFATTGLKIARGIPIFSQAAELAVTDPYVQFYRKEPWVNEDGQPRFSLAEAQSNAMKAYMGEGGPLAVVNNDAFALALTHYTDFVGEPPESDETDDSEERAMYGLPPSVKRNNWHPLERKLNHVRYMMLTDQEFATQLTEAVTEASNEVQKQGLSVAEEETSEEGFQPEPTD